MPTLHLYEGSLLNISNFLEVHTKAQAGSTGARSAHIVPMPQTSCINFLLGQKYNFQWLGMHAQAIQEVSRRYNRGRQRRNEYCRSQSLQQNPSSGVAPEDDGVVS